MACSAPVPRPVRVPDFPRELAEAATDDAWAAFELLVRSDGSVTPEALRVLGWQPAGHATPLFVALRQVAAGTRWEPRAAAHHALLVLDGAGRARWGDERPGALRDQLDGAERMRRRALAALDGRAASEHDLDCAWMTLAVLGSGAPFLHDDVEGWRAVVPRLRAAQERDAGFWVGRAARSTHVGQYVFLDAAGNVLGVHRYILGE